MMDKITLEIIIKPNTEPTPPPTKMFVIGQFLGKLYFNLIHKLLLKRKVEKILEKDWSKDYTNLDTPTVIRKHKNLTSKTHKR
jgi:hypothetical protein